MSSNSPYHQGHLCSNSQHAARGQPTHQCPADDAVGDGRVDVLIEGGVGVDVHVPAGGVREAVHQVHDSDDITVQVYKQPVCCVQTPCSFNNWCMSHSCRSTCC
jgi:hypothetical protein